jgi:hypothetical protein
MAIVAPMVILRINKKIIMHQLDYVGSHDADGLWCEPIQATLPADLLTRSVGPLSDGGVDRQQAPFRIFLTAKTRREVP